jgi:hypothetical protein
MLSAGSKSTSKRTCSTPIPGPGCTST